MYIQRLRFNKTVFTASKTFLCETFFFSFECLCMAVRNTVTTSVLMLLPWFFPRHKQFCPLLLQHQCKCQHSGKSKQCLFFFLNYETVLTSVILWKGLGDPEQSADHILRTNTMGHCNTKVEKLHKQHFT